MKQQIKNGIIFGLTAGIVFTLFGVVYAAWNDTVSNGDTVSASSWNALVAEVENIPTLSGMYLCPLIEYSCHWQSHVTPRCSGQVTDKSSCVPGLDDRNLTWCSVSAVACTSL